MVLEGVMIVLATGGLTIFHPAVAFQGVWSELNFNFRAKKGHTKVLSMTDEESPMSNVELSQMPLNGSTQYNGATHY
jgi:hypothetical protein